MYIRLNVKTLVCLYNEYVYMYPFVSPIRLFDSDAAVTECQKHLLIRHALLISMLEWPEK